MTASAKPDPLSVRCPYVRCEQGPGLSCGEMGPFEWGATKRPHPSRVRLARANAEKMAAVYAVLSTQGVAL